MPYSLPCRAGIVALLISCATSAEAKQPANTEQLQSSAWWLNRAVDYAKRIEDAEARSEANNKLVYALTEEGDFARALQSASEVTKPQVRVYVLSRIARLDHKKGDTATCDEALRIARPIAISAQFVSNGMIRLYFKLDRSDEAVTFAAAVPDRYQKRSAYQTVADEMAKQGRIDEALTIVSRHKPATSQDSGRASIAIACARASRFDQAIELPEKVEKVTARDAKALAAAKAIKSPSIGKSLLARKLIHSQAELGDSDGARASTSLLDSLPSDAARTQACLGAYDQLRVE